MSTVSENLEIFSGKDSIKKFLNPENHAFTPLVELPENLNRFLADGVHIYAKCEYLRPLMNNKSLQVLGMLQDAGRLGLLDGVHTLVESSSGNTGFSLAIIAKTFGIQNVMLLVPFDIAPGKLEMLRLVGAHIELCKTDGIAKALKTGQQEGFLNLNQYGNRANPDSVEKWLAPQIWEQTAGELSIFCAGLGTTGTMLGVSKFLKKKNSSAQIVGVSLVKDNAVPGVRTREKLDEIYFNWESMIDHRVDVDAKDSYKKSLELCREGLVAGPSSGFAFSGLAKFLECYEKDDLLDSIRNKNGEIIAVFVCADTPFPYLDKYSTHLDPTDF